MKGIHWTLLIAGAFLGVTGIVFLCTPSANLFGLAVFICLAMLVSGVSDIAYWMIQGKKNRSNWMLISGICSALFGLWFLIGNSSMPDISTTLPYVFAAWILVGGILRYVNGMQMKAGKAGAWQFSAGFGLLGMAMGFFTLYFPFFAPVVLSPLIAALFFYQGITSIALFWGIRKRGEK